MCVLSDLVEIEREEARRFMEIREVVALLEQLTLLSFETEEGEVIDAHKFIIFEFVFDLKNLFEPTDEDIIDSLSFDYQQGDVDENMVDFDNLVQQIGLDATNQALVTL